MVAFNYLLGQFHGSLIRWDHELNKKILLHRSFAVIYVRVAGEDIQVNYVSPNRKYSKILHSDEGNSERNKKWRMLSKRGFICSQLYYRFPDIPLTKFFQLNCVLSTSTWKRKSARIMIIVIRHYLCLLVLFGFWGGRKIISKLRQSLKLTTDKSTINMKLNGLTIQKI